MVDFRRENNVLKRSMDNGSTMTTMTAQTELALPNDERVALLQQWLHTLPPTWGIQVDSGGGFGGCELSPLFSGEDNAVRSAEPDRHGCAADARGLRAIYSCGAVIRWQRRECAENSGAGFGAGLCC